MTDHFANEFRKTKLMRQDWLLCSSQDVDRQLVSMPSQCEISHKLQAVKKGGNGAEQLS